MELEINGIKYKKIEKQQRKPLSKNAQKLLIMAAAFGGLDLGLSNKNMPNVDIIKEFGLIQNKKSSLSRKERDYVVFKFNQIYEQS